MINMLSQTIEQISKEKGIDPKVIYQALEEAMVVAARKFFKTSEDLQATYDPETGTIEVFAVREIVETVENPDTQMSLEEALEIDDTFEVSDLIEIPKDTTEFGRIAAQAAKQIIVQKVREAERKIIFEEFSDQVGVVVNGIVRRYEGRDVIMDIGRTEALLPVKEQSRNEHYAQGDRMRCIIVAVDPESKGPQIILSRNSPELMIKLFETEIPEVYDKTVLIMGAMREGGERAKVSVHSEEIGLDPVGACVGMRGSRIGSIIRELKGEKIDIIRYAPDILKYAVSALNPARISKVLITDTENKIMEVVVPKDQLSLAIGRKGQNVRLASRLIGWEINIKSEVEKKEEVLSEMDRLAGKETHSATLLDGVDDKLAELLSEADITTVETIADSTVEELLESEGVDEELAKSLQSEAAGFIADLKDQDNNESPVDEPEKKSAEDENDGK
jgi:transcription termination/antitermination protein NusA